MILVRCAVQNCPLKGDRIDPQVCVQKKKVRCVDAEIFPRPCGVHYGLFLCNVLCRDTTSERIRPRSILFLQALYIMATHGVAEIERGLKLSRAGGCNFHIASDWIYQ